MKILMIFFIVVFGLLGCSSIGIRKGDYYARMEKVSLGMSKAQFKAVFPESIARGAKNYTNGSIEILEVSHRYYSFVPTGNRNRNGLSGMEGQPQWFYFYNGDLLQYGNPEDWPEDPDLILEIRRR